MKFLKALWRPFLALVLIVILIKKGPFDVEKLKFVLTQKDILVSGLLVFFFQFFLFSIRWNFFISIFAKVPLKKILPLSLIGMFFNFFIPGGVGGDLVKALELSNSSTITKSEAFSTVMSDRIFGLFAMMTFTLIFLTFEYISGGEEFLFRYLFLSVLLFFGMTFSLLFLPLFFEFISKKMANKENFVFHKLEKILFSLHHTFITFRNLRLQILSLLLSLTSQILAISFMYFVVIKLGVTPPSFLIFFSFCCFGFLASAIPIFPAGIGVGQYASYAMFSHISPDLGTASVTAVTLVQIFNLFYALIGGGFFSFLPKTKKESLINT